MDKEFVDPTRSSRKRSARSEAAPERSDRDRPGLFSTIGNRAFRRLAASGPAPATAGGVQRSALPTQGAGPLDEEIAGAIDDRRGSGKSLPSGVRTDMESQLGADLSDVRVHTDSTSHSLNRAVQAEAFTSGSDVFFSSGTYSPDSGSGRKLLAHELTHVVQQRNGGGNAGQVSDPGDREEVEAATVAESIGSSPPSVDRSPAEELELGAPVVERQASIEEEEEPVQTLQREAMPEEEEEAEL